MITIFLLVSGDVVQKRLQQLSQWKLSVMIKFLLNQSCWAAFEYVTFNSDKQSF